MSRSLRNHLAIALELLGYRQLEPLLAYPDVTGHLRVMARTSDKLRVHSLGFAVFHWFGSRSCIHRLSLGSWPIEGVEEEALMVSLSAAGLGLPYCGGFIDASSLSSEPLDHLTPLLARLARAGDIVVMDAPRTRLGPCYGRLAAEKNIVEASARSLYEACNTLVSWISKALEKPSSMVIAGLEPRSITCASIASEKLGISLRGIIVGGKALEFPEGLEPEELEALGDEEELVELGGRIVEAGSLLDKRALIVAAEKPPRQPKQSLLVELRPSLVGPEDERKALENDTLIVPGTFTYIGFYHSLLAQRIQIPVKPERFYEDSLDLWSNQLAGKGYGLKTAALALSLQTIIEYAERLSIV